MSIKSWLRPAWLLNRRVGMALLWALLVACIAVAVNIVGIGIVGSIDDWERWLRAHSAHFLVWRLLVEVRLPRVSSVHASCPLFALPFACRGIREADTGLGAGDHVAPAGVSASQVERERSASGRAGFSRGCGR